MNRRGSSATTDQDGQAAWAGTRRVVSGLHARKLAYVLSAGSLARAVRPLSWPALLSGRVRLRCGLVLEASELFDLLVLKETVCDDVYRLRALAGPRLIVDVGAGIGDFSLVAASRFPAAQVIAFEPQPEAFAVLERNLAANELQNVEAHCVAVGTWRPTSSAETHVRHWPRRASQAPKLV